MVAIVALGVKGVEQNWNSFLPKCPMVSVVHRQLQSDSAMKELFKKWWQGTYVPPPRDDPYSSVIVFSQGTYRLHWSSKVAHVGFDFWMKYWQWCIGVTLAVIGIWKR